MKTVLTITVEDNGNHYQVYQKNEKGTISKLGNIVKPGETLFKGETPVDNYLAQHVVYGDVQWQNLDRALAYLISPRGMT